MARYTIPLTPEPQSFTITLAGIEYRLTLRWSWVNEGGWLLDIAQAVNDAPLVACIPLVTGADLLASYGYLGFGGMLWCFSNDGLPAGQSDLGTEVELIFETEEV